MKSSYVIANSADLPVLLPMVRAFHEEAHIPFHEIGTVQAVRKLIGYTDLGRIYLILSGDEIEQVVGYVALTRIFSIEFGGLCLFIDEFYLVPSARGQGVGHKILSEMIECEPNSEIRAFLLEVNPDNIAAQKLYRRMGFTARPYNMEYLVVKGLEEKG